MTGDLNTHFARNNCFTNLVSDCLENLGLVALWENPDNNPDHMIHAIDYTFLNASNAVVSSSVIDHFCVSENVFNLVKEAGVIHDGENLSHHSAIFMKIKLCPLALNAEHVKGENCVSWTQATDDAKEHFKANLSTQLQV